MRARVVIGAGYGDEGKGLLTDALAAEAGTPPLVVRFNGGAQAGHTVVAPDGRRHVFAHVGSGAFLGCATFLSRFFVSNPPLLHREWKALAALGVTPRVLADQRGLVTTPFDMLVNQAVETARGAGQHGSVGIGFGETIERNLRPPYAIAVSDLGRPDRLRGVLRAIRAEYVPARLRRLGVEPGEALQVLLADDALIERFLDDAALFLRRVAATGGAPLRDARDLVFEGAQGLLLDQHRGAFPHVTRSCTGLANVLALAGEAGIAALEVTYATRAYVTRHGAGPLAHALPGPPSPKVVDRTNRPHPFQGSLRFATLDLDVLRAAVQADLADAPAGMAVRARMAVTCLDQLPGLVAYVEAGERRAASAEALTARIGAICPDAPVLASRGEMRDTLREEAGQRHIRAA